MINIGKKDEVREQQAIEISKDTLNKLNSLGKDKFYEEWSKEINLDTQDPLEKCYVWLMKKYYLDHSYKDEYLLDVGCGVAPFLFKMEKKGYISIGLEQSIPKLNVCYALRNIFKDKKIYFYPGVGERLPFCEKWFDVVNSTMVLEHTRGPMALIGNMLRVSKLVTGIIHQDDQIGSPYHSWHMIDKKVLDLFNQIKNSGLIIKYDIEYFNEEHSRCCAFILYPNPDISNVNCEYIDVQKIEGPISLEKEWEQSYYEAILEYGKKIVEDPVLPIIVKPTKDGYILAGDGIHRVNALKRTSIEKIRVAINKIPIHN